MEGTGSRAQTWTPAVGLGGGLEAFPFQGHPLETHFINTRDSLAALVGFQTAPRKMTKKLVVYAISIYCKNTLFISFSSRNLNHWLKISRIFSALHQRNILDK